MTTSTSTRKRTFLAGVLLGCLLVWAVQTPFAGAQYGSRSAVSAMWRMVSALDTLATESRRANDTAERRLRLEERHLRQCR